MGIKYSKKALVSSRPESANRGIFFPYFSLLAIKTSNKEAFTNPDLLSSISIRDQYFFITTSSVQTSQLFSRLSG